MNHMRIPFIVCLALGSLPACDQQEFREGPVDFGSEGAQNRP